MPWRRSASVSWGSKEEHPRGLATTSAFFSFFPPNLGGRSSSLGSPSLRGSRSQGPPRRPRPGPRSARLRREAAFKAPSSRVDCCFRLLSLNGYFVMISVSLLKKRAERSPGSLLVLLLGLSRVSGGGGGRSQGWWRDGGAGGTPRGPRSPPPRDTSVLTHVVGMSPGSPGAPAERGWPRRGVRVGRHQRSPPNSQPPTHTARSIYSRLGPALLCRGSGRPKPQREELKLQ